MKIGILLFALGNILAWFQFISQFIWKWFADKPLTTNMIFAVPMGMCFWYAVKNVVEDTGELWSSKLVGFGVSNLVFATLTYFIVKESMFTPKTMTCLILGMIIVLIQIFWK